VQARLVSRCRISIKNRWLMNKSEGRSVERRRVPHETIMLDARAVKHAFILFQQKILIHNFHGIYYCLLDGHRNVSAHFGHAKKLHVRVSNHVRHHHLKPKKRRHQSLQSRSHCPLPKVRT
jgi:hypothetical protein